MSEQQHRSRIDSVTNILANKGLSPDTSPTLAPLGGLMQQSTLQSMLMQQLGA